MTNTRTDATLTWVCICCLLKLANDDVSGCENSCDQPTHRDSAFYVDHDPSAPAHHTLLLEEYPDDADLTIGMLIAEHDEACPARTDPGLECFGCEEREFSGMVCAGCGTHLAGSRHAVTMWTEAS